MPLIILPFRTTADDPIESDYDIRTVQELLGHCDVRTTMNYTHVLNRGGHGVQSPADCGIYNPKQRASLVCALSGNSSPDQMKRHDYNRSVSSADQAFSDWCASKNIPLNGIQHVITWEDWDDGIGVYIFLETIKQHEKLRLDEIDEMKNCYLAFLREFGYPFDKFPSVVFEFDSDENVRKNYAGSYFYRLR